MECNRLHGIENMAVTRKQTEPELQLHSDNDREPKEDVLPGGLPN